MGKHASWMLTFQCLAKNLHIDEDDNDDFG